ncbi:DUF4260 domain-containing protein [Enterococcus wangshanyuanii]|uniref:DUF4260 domain-containing protein n=1 Tax=Enterococcus wangshanyuanii TaxID=2005703 RepID=UPI000B4B22F4|nr:DUF4260 domain-containing protein [Enterococcus wangshanyuanii]
MKLILKLESISLFLIALFFYFSIFKFSWISLLIFLFVPDLSMIGYLFGNQLGAYVYNLVHHLLLPTILLALGLSFDSSFLLMSSLILFIHIFMDRSLGYGLKYLDSFHHTHLQ